MVSPTAVNHVPTTSLKLPDDIKQAAAEAAEQQGVTPHAFMVQAIRSAAEAARKRSVFVDDALAARAEVRESGKAYTAQDVHAYIRARAQGKKAAKPKAKPWRA